jgi:hypothetical protein
MVNINVLSGLAVRLRKCSGSSGYRLENWLAKYIRREEIAPIYHFVTIYEILIINKAQKTI